MYLQRLIEPTVLARAAQFRVLTLTGPRQSGKTTLARHLFADKPYFALDRPDVQSLLRSDPVGALGRLPSGAILDEVQAMPEILPYVRALVDETPTPGRFILTGSQNLALTARVSESLAGRTAVLELLPMSAAELSASRALPVDWLEVVWRGGFPALWAGACDPDAWLGSYAATYLERDVRQLSQVGDLRAFGAFLRLAAARSGTLLNLADLARDAGIAHSTATAWMSVLEASYAFALLPAWHANASKRLVKSPKLHGTDTGLLCNLLGLRSAQDLWQSPQRGAIVESWAASELRKARLNRGRRPDLYHFRTQTGAELDIVEVDGAHCTAVEVKSSATAVAEDFSKIERALDVLAQTRPGLPAPTAVMVYGGEATWSIGRTRAVGWRQWVEELAAVGEG